ncbi:ankyrin repeat domain-containing protein [Burkholderia sp. Bp9140]|uniref:ankyrin repeat domain-containing protein n=1 Tax=Burkholderia sp. Bp9140 TaxID=2184572 RepID=UPI000F570823|nr:ankyrin repeat domain-containing protein [Burkholderia sp. Bp9140]
MRFKWMAIVGSFALTTLATAVAAADGGALEGRLRSTNRYRGTALIPAAERGHVDTVRTPIHAGVDVDHVNQLGWSALLEAIMLGDGSGRYVRIVQLLVDATANVNLADSNGETPLQHARSRGYAPIERILVAAGGR